MNQRPPPPPPRSEEPIDESLLDALSPVEFEALRWSVRAADGLPPPEQAALQAWLDAAPEHRAAFDDLADVWSAIDDIPPTGTARLRTTLALDKAAESSAVGAPGMPAPAPTPADPPPAPHHEATPVRRRRGLSHALAAMLTFGVLGGGGWLGWDQWRQQPTFSRDYATQRGQNLAAELPDGSQLLLDTATRAGVTLYRNRREVRLPEGQVLFQVQGHQAQPFDVLAGAARITVVGTRFSVRYTPSLQGEQTVQVAVLEGRVRVARADDTHGAQAVELTPGQTVTTDAQGQPGAVSPMPTSAMAAWQHRRLDFDNVPLGRVLNELGRYGETGLRVQDAAVARLPVTASVDLQQIGTFARSLPEVLPVRLLRGADGTEIVAR